jgi:hypothetical protein
MTKSNIPTMKRKFYFIKDSVTGNFYEGKSADDIVSFDQAAVYFQRKNAEKKIKEYVNENYSGSWPWNVKCLTHPDLHWDKKLISKTKKMIAERKDLPNWGIEIVEVEVDAP